MSKSMTAPTPREFEVLTSTLRDALRGVGSLDALSVLAILTGERIARFSQENRREVLKRTLDSIEVSTVTAVLEHCGGLA